MNVKWIVDKFIFDDCRIPKETFEKLNIDFFEVEYIPIISESINLPDTYNENVPVIYYGTINCADFFKNQFGYFLNKENFKCNVYMSNLNVDRTDFLNHDCVYTTFKDLEERKDFWYETIHNNCIFVRPNSGVKSFTGKPILKIDFDHEIEMFKKLYNIFPEEIVLISTPKNIMDENRFLICGEDIIDYTRYRNGGKKVEDRNVHKDNIEFVEKIVDELSWVPEEMFVIDVGRIEENGNNIPKIIELNSFSCSGWYGMDYEHVIKSVSRYVQKLFNEQNEIQL